MMSEMGEKFNLRQWARTASSGCGAMSESALQLVLNNQLTALSTGSLELKVKMVVAAGCWH